MEQGSKNRYAGSANGSLHSLCFNLFFLCREWKQKELRYSTKLCMFAQQLLIRTLAAF